MLSVWEVVMWLAIILFIEALVIGAYNLGIRRGQRKHAPAFTPPHEEPTPEQVRKAAEIQKSISNMMSYDLATARRRKESAIQKDTGTE